MSELVGFTSGARDGRALGRALRGGGRGALGGRLGDALGRRLGGALHRRGLARRGPAAGRSGDRAHGVSPLTPVATKLPSFAVESTITVRVCRTPSMAFSWW